MSLASTHHELDEIAPGRFRHVQHMKPIASYRNGSLRRDPFALSATGSADWPFAVDGICDVRVGPRIAGKSPLVHIGHGRDMVRFSLVGANNVQGAVKGNATTFVNAWNNADLRYTYGGHKLQEEIILRTGHPKSFGFIVQEHTGFDPLTLSFGSFRIQQPSLEKGDVTVPLQWLATSQGGKWLLTVHLPVGDWTGWTLDPTLSLQPDAAGGKDTYVNAGAATTNYGTATNLYTKGAPNTYHSLIEFDLSSIVSTATCVSATLSLYVQQMAANATHTLYPILAANDVWTEAGATYNTKDGANAWAGGATGCGTGGTDHSNTAIGSTNVTNGEAQGTEHAISLTAATVGTWFGASNVNYGVVIKSNYQYNNQIWYSSDHTTASQRPKLVIDYTLPGSGGIFASSIFHSAIHGQNLTR